MDGRFTRVTAVVVAFLMVGGVARVLSSQGSSSEGYLGSNDETFTQGLELGPRVG